jgi:hypothetical protein
MNNKEDPRINVVLVLPCYNEQASIDLILLAISEVFAVDHEMSTKVIFVDDGSTDDTQSKIADAIDRHTQITVSGLRLQSNEGKAFAQAIGLKYATANESYVVLMDSDGQHDPSLLPDVILRCVESQRVQIAKRINYRRRGISEAGHRILRKAANALGLGFDPELAEFVVLPPRVARSLADHPQIGILPLIPLIQSSVGDVNTFDAPIRARSDGSESTRWSVEELWRKALLHLLVDPWKLFPRLASLVGIAVLLLGGYGLLVGFISVIEGKFLGVGSILIAIVVTFALVSTLNLFLLGFIVITLKGAETRREIKVEVISHEEVT